MSIRLVIALRISHTVLPPPSILLITGARECHSKVHSPRRAGSSFRATICTRICGGELLTEPLDRRFLYTSTPRVSCAPRRRGKSGCRRRDRYLPLSEFPRRRPLARLCTRGQVCARAASYLYERHKKCDGEKCKREREWLREKERIYWTLVAWISRLIISGARSHGCRVSREWIFSVSLFFIASADWNRRLWLRIRSQRVAGGLWLM